MVFSYYLFYQKISFFILLVFFILVFATPKLLNPNIIVFISRNCINFAIPKADILEGSNISTFGGVAKTFLLKLFLLKKSEILFYFGLLFFSYFFITPR